MEGDLSNRRADCWSCDRVIFRHTVDRAVSCKFLKHAGSAALGRGRWRCGLSERRVDLDFETTPPPPPPHPLQRTWGRRRDVRAGISKPMSLEGGQRFSVVGPRARVLKSQSGVGAIVTIAHWATWATFTYATILGRISAIDAGEENVRGVGWCAVRSTTPHCSPSPCFGGKTR